ncbi:MAG: lipid-A-disaccharide synthase [Planctomycetota bacterium]|nr:lipid-A-disaccharide synthase [Planctomycetota bacterium]
MPNAERPPRILICAAEQSGDEHAAELIRAARASIPDVSFVGLAGPRMQAEGCECIHDMTIRAAMAAAAWKRVPEAIQVLRRLKAFLAVERIDAAVLVDSPTLNLPIAKICRRRKVPVLYYIAPQTWAWAPWRNRRIRARVDRIACIWPFEESYFRGYGIRAAYVGHPSFDRLLAVSNDPEKTAAIRKRGEPVVTILPGSRRHVIDEVLPGQLEIARALSKRFKKIHFVVVSASESVQPEIANVIRRECPHLSIMDTCGADERAAAIRAADLVLAASGTVTLEVAYHGTPMIVMYNASRLLYQFVGRWIISTPYFSIPNILAGRRIVPEFMPYYRSVTPIIAQASELLATPASLKRIRDDLKSVMEPIIKPGAAKNAARELAGVLVDRCRTGSG